MELIFKFTLRNIWENKLRTFLIIFAVMLSAALFFGSSGLSRTIADTYTRFLTKYHGTAEIMVAPGEASPSSLMTAEKLRDFYDEVEYALGVMHSSGIYRIGRDEVQQFNLLGYEFPDIKRMHTVVLAEESNLEPFQGRKVIISEVTARKYGLGINENISLEIAGDRIQFKIVGIAKPTGLFLEDGRNTSGVVPREYLNSRRQVRGRADTIYLKLRDPSQKQDFIERVSRAYPSYEVTETISDEDIKDYTDQVIKPFLFMVAIVMLISVFIIYTSFKVIALERIPVLGTFRSLGATRRAVNLVFLTESLLYGVIGGLSGCILGIGVLHIMARLTTPKWLEGITTQVSYTPLHVVGTFLVAVALSFCSAFFPIWRVSHIPVKDIVINNTETGGSPPKNKYILGGGFIIISLILPPLASAEMLLPSLVLSIVLGIVGLILVLPVTIVFFLNFLQGFYVLVFGNEGILALKNLRDNKNISNNIALLSIGILSILVVKIVGVSVMTEVTSYFRDWKFQIQAVPSGADRSMQASLRSIPGVIDTYGVLTVRDVEVLGTGYKIGAIEGINDRFFDFMDMRVPDGPEAVLEKLNSGRYILLAKLVKERLGVEEGDIINLDTPRGKVPYQVLGTIDTLENNGQYAIISERYLKLDLEQKYYDCIYIKTRGDPDTVRQEIQRKFSRNPFPVETVRSIVATNRQVNERLFLLIDGFSYLTMLIGLFGVFNNYLISFLERRRPLAVLRSVGMSRRQTVKVLLVEALTGGFIAGIYGIVGGLMGISTIRYLLRSMGMKGEIRYDLVPFLLAIFLGVIISVLASLSPTLENSKRSIVAELKYE